MSCENIKQLLTSSDFFCFFFNFCINSYELFNLIFFNYSDQVYVNNGHYCGMLERFDQLCGLDS